MEMSGLEYVGSLAILVLFFIVLVKLGEEFGKKEDPDVPLFGFPASEKASKRLPRSYNRYKKNKKKKKRKKRRK